MKRSLIARFVMAVDCMRDAQRAWRREKNEHTLAVLDATEREVDGLLKTLKRTRRDLDPGSFQKKRRNRRG